MCFLRRFSNTNCFLKRNYLILICNGHATCCREVGSYSLNIIKQNFQFSKCFKTDDSCLGHQTHDIRATNIHYLTPVFTLHTAMLTKSESIHCTTKQIKTPSHIPNAVFFFSSFFYQESTNLRRVFSIFLLFLLLWRRIRESPGAGTRGIGKKKKRGGRGVGGGCS